MIPKSGNQFSEKIMHHQGKKRRVDSSNQTLAGAAPKKEGWCQNRGRCAQATARFPMGTSAELSGETLIVAWPLDAETRNARGASALPEGARKRSLLALFALVAGSMAGAGIFLLPCIVRTLADEPSRAQARRADVTLATPISTMFIAITAIAAGRFEIGAAEFRSEVPCAR